MRCNRKSPLCLLASICLALCLVAVLASRASAQKEQSQAGRFQLTSSTFTTRSTLPISTINNIVQNGKNICSIDGSTGGNQSPELSWTNAPARTQSFVVVTYDVTAAFTHWGMYNIPATTNELPENAGVAGSPYGSQIVNDFFTGAEYDGPCPPAGVAPSVHHYVFHGVCARHHLAIAWLTELPGERRGALSRADSSGAAASHSSQRILGWFLLDDPGEISPDAGIG